MKLQLNNIQHIGIPVTNLAKSIAFYESLGFKNVMTSTFMVNKNEGNVSMMQSGNIIMELYQLPENELAEIRTRKNGHVDHVAFDVADIDEVFNTLKNENFEILEAAPVFLPFWKNGCRYFNIKGPDGERLEFNQIL